MTNKEKALKTLKLYGLFLIVYMAVLHMADSIIITMFENTWMRIIRFVFGLSFVLVVTVFYIDPKIREIWSPSYKKKWEDFNEDSL